MQIVYITDRIPTSFNLVIQTSYFGELTFAKSTFCKHSHIKILQLEIYQCDLTIFIQHSYVNWIQLKLGGN